MSDLRDLPDLADDVRERVVTPPYDEVSRRVQARRLRGTAGGIAAAVLLVGGVAVWQNAATTAGPPVPEPAQETPIPPTDESQWRAVVDGTDAHPFEIEGTDDGAIAVIWRALEQPEPTFALVIREADGTLHGRRLETPVDLTPVPGGWVGVHAARGWFIGSDGSFSDLGREGAPRAPGAGDVIVTHQYGLSLFSPVDRSWSSVNFNFVATDAWLTADGTFVTCRYNGYRILLREADDRVGEVPGEDCVLAGRGDTVAVVGLEVDTAGALRMSGLAVWDDGTLTLPRTTTLLEGVTSLVVTPDGSTVVTDASSGRWLLVRADGEVVEPDRKVGEAFVAGDRLYVTSYGIMDGPMSVSDDDGVTWQESVLPGNAE